MLITFIVTVAILLFLYILINICNKTTERSDYEFSTGATKSLFIFAHILFGISFLAVASEIIIYFFNKDQAMLWSIYGIFLTFAIFGLFMLYSLYFTYEAISGDEVYIHRFFKIKRFKVNDIRRINVSQLIIAAYGKNDKCLFLADGFTQGIHELIRLINERKTYSDDEEAAIAEENAVFKKLGQEYRASYNERKKKFIINFFVVGIIIWAAIVALLFFIGTDTYRLVTMAILCAVTLAFTFFMCLYTMKKELTEDNLKLGKKFKFKNKKVKGANKFQFKMLCIVCACCMFLGALFTLPLLTIFHEKPNYDEYTRVTGKLEYCRENTGKYSYIAIGFEDMPTEYRLGSTYLDELDYSFLNEAKVGDTVTILVDNDEDREFSIRGVSKKKWNDCYYLAIGSKEYFSYEDYIKSHENEDRTLWIIVGVGITMFAAATIAIICGYFVCKNREKYEDIVIYK